MSLGRFKRVPSIFQRLKPRFPEKWKGGRLEKIGNYFYNIYADYKMVAIETVQDMKKKPVKASMYISLITVAYGLNKTKPSGTNFKERIRDYANDMILVSETIRNSSADKYLADLSNLDNEKCLRYLNLGICTIVYRSSYSTDASIFAAQCKYVKPHFTEFHKQILDVGIAKRWIYLDKAMLDYDVNPDEWLEDGSPRVKVPMMPLI